MKVQQRFPRQSFTLSVPGRTEPRRVLGDANPPLNLQEAVCAGDLLRLDTAIMLRTAVHAAVLEVINGLTASKGVRALSENDRKPIIRELGESGAAHLVSQV